MNEIIIFIICLLISFGLPTVLGASYKYYTADWYLKLKKPKFAFPDIVFIVIFPIFYFLEAIGLYLILSNSNQTSLPVYGLLFLSSVVLSAIWSRLFFIQKRCDLSLITFFLEFPFSWIFVYLLFRENHLAYAFFLPRVIWGFYAIFANIQFYRLNKEFWDSVKKS
jgi:tryptophan-rich sensory protein